jgi:hypothetical protein
LAIKKKSVFYVNSAVKPKNFVVFSFSNVSGGSVLFYEDFGMNSYSVAIDGAMKQGNEALSAS